MSLSGFLVVVADADATTADKIRDAFGRIRNRALSIHPAAVVYNFELVKRLQKVKWVAAKK